jgi:hypothetical protein
MSEKQTLVGEFDKNSAELICVHLQTWKIQRYIDVRIWVKGDPGHPGAEQATRKGICLNVELLPDLLRLLEEARRVIEKGEEPAPEVGENDL